MLGSETNHQNTSFPHFPWSDKHFEGDWRRVQQEIPSSLPCLRRGMTTTVRLYCNARCRVRYVAVKRRTSRQWWIMRRGRLCLPVMGIQPLHRWSTMQHSAPLQGFSTGCRSVSPAVTVHNGVTEMFPLSRTFRFLFSHHGTSFSNPS